MKTQRHKTGHLKTRNVLGLVLSLSLSGCAATQELSAQLQAAQRERTVLRDAYEAQRLRIKELELRLLRLEDRKLTSTAETLASPNKEALTATYEEMPKHVDDGGSQTSTWRARRLRALPVVRVSAAQSLGAAGESDYPRERARNRDRAESADRDPRAQKRRARRHASATRDASRRASPHRAVSTRHDERPRPSQALSPETPTLTAQNLSRYEERRRGRSRTREPSAEQSPTRAPRDVTDTTSAVEPSTRPLLSTSSHVARQPSSQTHSAQGTTGLTSTPPVSSSLSVAAQLLQRANQQRSRGQLAASMRLVRQLISECPTDPLVPDALYLMGRLQVERGDASSGRATLIRLSRLYPSARAAKEAVRFLASQSPLSPQ